MGSYLERCPADVVEEIGQLLELKDIQSLRLVGTVVSGKASNWKFHRMCLSKHVET